MYQGNDEIKLENEFSNQNVLNNGIGQQNSTYNHPIIEVKQEDMKKTRKYGDMSQENEIDELMAKRRKQIENSYHMIDMWVSENRRFPYPSNEQKMELAKKTDLSLEKLHERMEEVRSNILRKLKNKFREELQNESSLLKIMKESNEDLITKIIQSDEIYSAEINSRNNNFVDREPQTTSHHTVHVVEENPNNNIDHVSQINNNNPHQITPNNNNHYNYNNVNNPLYAPSTNPLPLPKVMAVRSTSPIEREDVLSSSPKSQLSPNPMKSRNIATSNDPLKQLLSLRKNAPTGPPLVDNPSHNIGNSNLIAPNYYTPNLHTNLSTNRTNVPNLTPPLIPPNNNINFQPKNINIKTNPSNQNNYNVFPHSGNNNNINIPPNKNPNLPNPIYNTYQNNYEVNNSPLLNNVPNRNELPYNSLSSSKELPKLSQIFQSIKSTNAYASPSYKDSNANMNGYNQEMDAPHQTGMYQRDPLKMGNDGFGETQIRRQSANNMHPNQPINNMQNEYSNNMQNDYNTNNNRPIFNNRIKNNTNNMNNTNNFDNNFENNSNTIHNNNNTNNDILGNVKRINVNVNNNNELQNLISSLSSSGSKPIILLNQSSQQPLLNGNLGENKIIAIIPGDQNLNLLNIGGETRKKETQNVMYEEGINQMLGNQSESSRYFKKRFPRNAIQTLENWLYDNRSNPYPTKSEKERLGEITGLTQIQINNWFTNNRRKAKTVFKHKIAKDLGVNSTKKNKKNSNNNSSSNDGDDEDY